MKIPYNRPVYRIGHVEERTKIDTHRIRYLEKIGLIRPDRTRGRQRLYSQKDVATIRTFVNLRKRGLSNFAIIQLLEECRSKKKKKN